MLTHKGIDINKQDSTGVTPLHIAARLKESAGVQALLARPGIQVNLRDQSGQTALHWASAAGTFNIIRCLVSVKEAEIHAKDRAGVYFIFKRLLLTYYRKRTDFAQRSCSKPENKPFLHVPFVKVEPSLKTEIASTLVQSVFAPELKK
jgi:ankyrin repeat protein